MCAMWKRWLIVAVLLALAVAWVWQHCTLSAKVDRQAEQIEAMERQTRRLEWLLKNLPEIIRTEVRRDSDEDGGDPGSEGDK